MAKTSTTSHENPPHLDSAVTHNFDVDKQGRKFGIILGLAVAAYLLIVNVLFVDLPMSIRFAKHLLIIPIVGYAVKAYADSVYANKDVFKGEIGLLFRIGVWATLVLAVLNIVLSSIDPNLGFEQFLNENTSFGDVMMNSFFVAMETLIFVMIIGFVFLQYYKRGGSPED